MPTIVIEVSEGSEVLNVTCDEESKAIVTDGTNYALQAVTCDPDAVVLAEQQLSFTSEDLADAPAEGDDE